MITRTDRLLTSGRPLAGLLNAAPQSVRSAKLKELVHELWQVLRTVRQDKSPEALYKSMILLREINELGFAVLVLEKGRIVGAEDLRFKGKDLQVEDQTSVVSEERLRSEKFLRLKRLFDRLSTSDQEKLLREMRMKWSQQHQTQPTNAGPKDV